MINHISIQNFAIIENTEIDFEDGLNVITGETGSGKSIVIEAVSLALGSRADSSFVRHGKEKAVVQLAGELDGEDIVITREVSSAGKNLCKLNGQLVTLTQLSETCRRLADIHGQYDNQSLLNPENHLLLVDRFQEKEISPVKKAFEEAYSAYRSAKSRLDQLIAQEAEQRRKLDFYRFEKDEIDHADLKPGEDTALTERVSLLQNSEKIFAGIETAYGHLNEGESSAMSSLGTCLQALEGVSGYSRDISAVTEDFSDLYYRLEDISASLRHIREEITFTPEELDLAIERLDLIEKLKKKYGSSIEEILAYAKRIGKELEEIENFDEIKAQREKETASCEHALRIQAELLSQVRKLSAEKLEKAIEKELRELNFDNASLLADFRTPPEITPSGNDIVEFMISANKGEPPKPLVKIASGGEISRIMLAIKNITGTYDRIPTMIFDEIDAGISGITASVVGRKLHQIAKSHQIICITHLPQIAACAGTHYRIHKETDDNNTYTQVDKLTAEQAVDEIAKLLGGETITETTRKSAEELIAASRQ